MHQLRLPVPEKFEFNAFKVVVTEGKSTWVTHRPAYYYPSGVRVEILDEVVAIHYAASTDSHSIQTRSWRRPALVVCQGPIDGESLAVWTVTLMGDTKREMVIDYQSAPMLPLPLKKLVQEYHRTTPEMLSLAGARQKAINDSHRAQQAQIEYAEAEAQRCKMEY